MGNERKHKYTEEELLKKWEELDITSDFIFFKVMQDEGLLAELAKRCHEVNGLELGDGTNIIVLNAQGTKGRISKKLKNFLEYVAGKTVEDDFVKRLDLSVSQAKKSKEWRKDYMTWMQTKLELMEMGREEGRENINNLNRWLMEQGRNEDMIRSFSDPEFQEDLLREMQEQEKAEVPV